MEESVFILQSAQVRTHIYIQRIQQSNLISHLFYSTLRYLVFSCQTISQTGEKTDATEYSNEPIAT